LLWQQSFDGDGEGFGKADEFRIGDPAETGFDFGSALTRFGGRQQA
jgi:hypothetical protein